MRRRVSADPPQHGGGCGRPARHGSARAGEGSVWPLLTRQRDRWPPFLDAVGGAPPRARPPRTDPQPPRWGLRALSPHRGGWGWSAEGRPPPPPPPPHGGGGGGPPLPGGGEPPPGGPPPLGPPRGPPAAPPPPSGRPVAASSTAVWAQRSIPAGHTATAVATAESGRAERRPPCGTRRGGRPRTRRRPNRVRPLRPVAQRQQRRAPSSGLGVGAGPSGATGCRARPRRHSGGDASQRGIPTGARGDLSLA